VSIHSEHDREKGARPLIENSSENRYTRGADNFAVTMLDEKDDPKKMTHTRKWIAIVCISSASLCAATASSIVSHPFFLRAGRKFTSIQ
jgi:hypothetical protein